MAFIHVQYFSKPGDTFLVLPGVVSACLVLRCLARQDEPRPMLSAASDIWLPAQVVTPNNRIVHNTKCSNIPLFSVRQAVFLYTSKCSSNKICFRKNSAYNEIIFRIACQTWSLNLVSLWFVMKSTLGLRIPINSLDKLGNTFAFTH